MEEMLPPENPMGTARISGLVLKKGLPLVIPAGMALWKKESGKSLKPSTVMSSE